MVNHVFDAYSDKLDQAMREPLLVAAMTHDSEYIPAARAYAKEQRERIAQTMGQMQMPTLQDLKKLSPLFESLEKWDTFLRQLTALESGSPEDMKHLWMDGGFPSQINKKTLDPHAELGAERIQRDYGNPALAAAYASWTPAQKEVAAVAIRDHSNGSAYDPYATPLEAQALRMVDKLDNTYHRVPDWMLNIHSQKDPARCHRYVPTAIRSQSLIIDRAHREMRIVYDVDTSFVERQMQRQVPDFRYSPEQFLEHFDQAYGHSSMPRAAEVHAKLEAQEGEMYSKEASFNVELRFPDGKSVINTYDPIPTAPTFR